MEDFTKRLKRIEDNLAYIAQIKDDSEGTHVSGILEKTAQIRRDYFAYAAADLEKELASLEDGVAFLENRCEEQLTPMERVRIVRNPLRFSLLDILENVYEDFTELGGLDEANIDPAIVVAKATIIRRVRKKTFTHKVMVIGHEKGHGEEYRNGGSARPWGNEKALRYMKVAQTEGIPVHSYIFTPGAYPIEDYPGAAQQIARNLYVIAKLQVPIIAVISEGGSGGAEAIGLADRRLMFSHGYYSVISPEGAAAIEGKIREGGKVPSELVEECATRLKITASDNLELGTIDKIIPEPPLGAKRDDFLFFRQLKIEVIRATDEVVLQTRSLRAFRAYELRAQKAAAINAEEPHIENSWELDREEKIRLLALRSKKYRAMAIKGYEDGTGAVGRFLDHGQAGIQKLYYGFRYDLLKNHEKQVRKVIQEVSGEGSIFLQRLTAPITAAYQFIKSRHKEKVVIPPRSRENWGVVEFGDLYTSPLANEDRTVTCPNTARYGCRDLWVPDLYGEFCGVCENCGHHFPLEYQWYIRNLFDKNSIREFNEEIHSLNPLHYPAFDRKLSAARVKTARGSALVSFLARVMDIEVVVAMLYSDFRNGTVGAAEGEKFVRACETARIRKRPLLSYVHTTGGIRIHEGTLGVIQMPKCTMAVREYVDSGGLYIVVYDNNSYAGPVASFLGCSNYQFAIRSCKVGFAGSRVIRETTGQDAPPDYHNARSALKRGHIQGIWDRRDFRRNLHKALLTMGGGNLYYK